MRGWILGVIVLVALVGAGLYFMGLPPQAGATAQQTMVQRDIRGVRDSYHRHRQQFQSVSGYSRQVRTNRIVAVVGFLAFVLLTLPKNARGARGFYRQMMEKAPLPAVEGITDDDNRRARQVLFFYLLFLLYQIVQFPLTWGRDNTVQFASDLVIQFVLLVAVGWAYHRLKRGLTDRWKPDPARGEKMDAWAGHRLEGLNIRWRDVRKMAVGVFVAGFAPALLSRATDALDMLSAYSQRFTGP
jgi:hypothetical protein